MHSVANMIVSIKQPYIHPIVGGKVESLVEFGTKYDIYIDEKGYAYYEKLSFDVNNESLIFVKRRGIIYRARVSVAVTVPKISNDFYEVVNSFKRCESINNTERSI